MSGTKNKITGNTITSSGKYGVYIKGNKNTIQSNKIQGKSKKSGYGVYTYKNSKKI